MKLVLAIVHDDDAAKLVRLLNQEGFMVTKLVSSGGFLRVGNTTLISGVEDEKVEDVLNIFRTNCKMKNKMVGDFTPYTNLDGFVRRPIGVKVGGATVFVLDVDQFVKI